MKTTSTIRNATIWLACLGFLSPATLFGAQPTGTVTNKAQVQDVAMGATNTLSGQLVNAQGQRLANAPVVIQNRAQETIRTVTDGEGRFQATNLRGGVYQVAAGSTSGVYRLWSEAAAPPAAAKGLLLVDTQTTVRGQCASGACGDGGGYPVMSGDYGAPVSYGGDACGAPVAYDACGGGACGGGACGAGGCGGGLFGGGGGGLLGLLSNPWVIGAGVAAAIAIPLALDDDDAS